MMPDDKDIKMRGFNPPIYIDLTFNSYRSVIHMKIDLFRQYFLIGNKLNISMSLALSLQPEVNPFWQIGSSISCQMELAGCV